MGLSLTGLSAGARLNPVPFTRALWAATAHNAARQAVSMSGVEETSMVAFQSSRIVPGGSGIEITGQAIALTGVTVHASAADNGGSVKFGGNLQPADTVTIDTATLTLADATSDGNGIACVVGTHKGKNNELL